MDQEPSLLRSGPRLTPELFDFHVARARKERGKAIAAFGEQIGAWVVGLVRRLARRGATCPRAPYPRSADDPVGRDGLLDARARRGLTSPGDYPTEEPMTGLTSLAGLDRGTWGNVETDQAAEKAGPAHS